MQIPVSLDLYIAVGTNLGVKQIIYILYRPIFKRVEQSINKFTSFYYEI